MTVSAETTTRTQRMKKRVLEAPYSICIERARYVTESFRRTEGMHPSWRAALAFRNTLENMTVFIQDDERVVGNTCSRIVGTIIPVERGEINVILEMYLDELTNRPRQAYHIHPDDRRELLEKILPYWKGKTVRDARREYFERNDIFFKPRISPDGVAGLLRGFGPEQIAKMFSRVVRLGIGNLARAGNEIPHNNPNLVNNVFDVQGHLVVGNNRVIREGFQGIHARAVKGLKAPLPEGKKKVLESVAHSCEAAKMFAGRYASLARELAGREADPVRREELLDIARHADHTPWSPPRTFHEAVQCLWFTQVLAAVSYGTPCVCAIGRPDQYLLPFFQRDVASGAIDHTVAVELIEEALIKLSNNLIVLPSFAKDTGSELGADSMAPTLGGLGPDGADAVNDLSYLFLDAIRNIRGMSNSYSIRISRRTPDAFVRRVAEVQAVTSGMALFNDEAVIAALEKSGCSIEDARDYAVVGCVEPTSQGNTFGCTSGNDVSLAGVLEMTLNRGKLRMMNRRVGPDTGDPARFRDFDEFMRAYRIQLRWAVDLIAQCVDAKDEIYMRGFHNPFISATLDGCVENAEDMTEGGAKYNFASISGRGLATTADSLTAIRKFVFDERKLTMRELLEALDNNFRGHEKLRALLASRSPRYGADNDEADAMAREVASLFCDEVTRHRSIRKGGPFRPGFFSYGMHVYDGSMLGATPDGRLAGRPVSNSLSPSNGAEKLGPTAAMRSAARIDHTKILNGCSLNIKLTPRLLESEQGRANFQALARGYFQMGGMHAQFNVVDNKTLRDAQRRPELYSDLIVRVSGYVAYFTDLGKPLQDDIIDRTEFSHY